MGRNKLVESKDSGTSIVVAHIKRSCVAQPCEPDLGFTNSQHNVRLSHVSALDTVMASDLADNDDALLSLTGNGLKPSKSAQGKRCVLTAAARKHVA